MSIEHRWTPRQLARLPVSIACRPLGLLQGRLRDISNGGAMVQLATALPLNAPVELILPLRAGTGTRSYRVPAIVTRCGETGVGLMFGRIESDLWSALVAQAALQGRADNDGIDGIDNTAGAGLPASTRS